MATTNSKKKINTLRSGLSLREFLKHLAVLPHKPPPKMKLLCDFAVRCFLLRPLFELWSRTLNPLLFGGPVFISFTLDSSQGIWIPRPRFGIKEKLRKRLRLDADVLLAGLFLFPIFSDPGFPASACRGVAVRELECCDVGVGYGNLLIGIFGKYADE